MMRTPSITCPSCLTPPPFTFWIKWRANQIIYGQAPQAWDLGLIVINTLHFTIKQKTITCLVYFHWQNIYFPLKFYVPQLLIWLQFPSLISLSLSSPNINQSTIGVPEFPSQDIIRPVPRQLHWLPVSIPLILRLCLQTQGSLRLISQVWSVFHIFSPPLMLLDPLATISLLASASRGLD